MKNITIRGWSVLLLIPFLVYGFVHFLLTLVEQNQTSLLNPELAAQQMFHIWTFGLYLYAALGVAVVLLKKATLKEFIFGDEREKAVDQHAFTAGFYILIIGLCLTVAMPSYGAERVIFYSATVAVLTFSVIAVTVFVEFIENKSALLKVGS